MMFGCLLILYLRTPAALYVSLSQLTYRDYGGWEGCAATGGHLFLSLEAPSPFLWSSAIYWAGSASLAPVVTLATLTCG